MRLTGMILGLETSCDDSSWREHECITNFIAIYPVDVQNLKCKPRGGARGKSRVTKICRLHLLETTNVSTK